MLNKYLSRSISAAPLAFFRISIGLLMVISIVRFWHNGWIESLYLSPKFHFKYLWFEWVKVPNPYLCYILFLICGISAFLFSIGYKYRLSIILFFLSFTYIELMDKTTYLNHYYFISIISFILIFLPANKYFSVDAYRNPSLNCQFIPQWNIDVIKLMLAIVYFYAGLAKLNYDWIFNAMPLTIWLPSKVGLPIIGSFMDEKWIHYLFSWSGALYDLTIPFFLLFKRTRLYAFMAVLIFHILTRVLFPIGMFPYIMIISTLVFFQPKFHNKILEYLSLVLRINKKRFDNGITLFYQKSKTSNRSLPILTVVIILQILIPLRFFAYPGNIFWTEQGYRFSWRVMLMEKTGYANFKIVDKNTGRRFYVQNEDFLTPFQQKQMSTQPDFIIEYAHYLGEHFQNQGHKNMEIYVESYASLNGRLSQPYIDPNVNLLDVENSLRNKTYILKSKDEK